MVETHTKKTFRLFFHFFCMIRGKKPLGMESNIYGTCKTSKQQQVDFPRSFFFFLLIEKLSIRLYSSRGILLKPSPNFAFRRVSDTLIRRLVYGRKISTTILLNRQEGRLEFSPIVQQHRILFGLSSYTYY